MTTNDELPVEPVDETFDFAAGDAAAKGLDPDARHDEPYDEQWQETYKRLAENASAENPPAWMPTEPGEELMGVFLGVNPAAPTKYGAAPVVTMKKPDGELVSVWLMQKVLRLGFERAKPSVGEVVLVRYVGKVQPDSPGAEAYHNFRVVLDRGRNAPADWDEIAVRYGDEVHLPTDAIGRTGPDAEDDIPF